MCQAAGTTLGVRQKQRVVEWRAVQEMAVQKCRTGFSCHVQPSQMLAPGPQLGCPCSMQPTAGVHPHPPPTTPAPRLPLTPP